jgi:ribosomal protein S18 acetylase RimI-like enzyme
MVPARPEEIMALKSTQCLDKAEWDQFVKDSPQGNIFCRSAVLEALGEEYELWFVEDGGERLLGTVIITRDGQPIRAPYPHAMYQGVLLSAKVYKLAPHRRVWLTLELTSFLLAEMKQRFNRISFCLHHRFEDLRSFSWFHYDEPEQGQFEIALRYTALIDLSPFESFDQYLRTIRRDRRYDYRHARSEGLVISESTDLQALERLCDLTYARQGIERDPKAKLVLKSITQAAVAGGFGELLACTDPSGALASMIVFLYDNKYGYNWVGGTDPQYRSSGAATYLILENIKRCKARGLTQVDVIGINSPQRGNFKTGFNAVPVPYFVVTWEGCSNLNDGAR